MTVKFNISRHDQVDAETVSWIFLSSARALGRIVAEGRIKYFQLSFAPVTIDLSALLRRGLPVPQVALRTGLAPQVIEAFAAGLASSRDLAVRTSLAR